MSPRCDTVDLMEKAALLAACCLVGLEDVLLSSNSQETPLNDHKRHQAVLHLAQDHKNPLWEKNHMLV